MVGTENPTTFSKRWLVVAVAVLALSACQKNNQPQNATPQSSEPKPQALAVLDSNINANLNTRAINLGRASAVYRQLARKWQLQAIDGVAVSSPSPAVLDLTLIEQNTATLLVDKNCRTVYITLDTGNLVNGELLVVDISRELEDCSSPLEDSLMAMLGDTRGFNQEQLINNVLVVNSFQNKLTFLPYNGS